MLIRDWQKLLKKYSRDCTRLGSDTKVERIIAMFYTSSVMRVTIAFLHFPK